MAFKMVSRKLRRRLIAPTISIGKAGLYLNRAAMDVIGTDKKAVILYFDSDTEPPQIGMWFHKDKPSSPHPHDAYAVVHYPSGVSRVSAKRFVEDYGLMAIKRKLGKVSYMITLDKEQETGRDFYHAELS